jgi:X-Pro dipeptidyl-peptidase
MRRSTIAAALAMSLIAGLVAMGSASARAPKSYTPSPVEEHLVNTRHGNLYVEIVRPLDGNKDVKGPVVLTLSPYSALGRGDNRELVSKGYVVAFADVVGTGNSGGCYDYGGKREKETAYDLVEWLAKQKWSTGKVAMTGGSYNGTTAWAAAVEQPPHLTTIIPEAAIVRWYDYAYSGGIRYFLNNENPSDEGVDTPVAFDFGLAVPPPLDYEHQDWTERVQENLQPCDEVDHTTHGYDDTPDYDKFWVERDYLRDIPKIKIPVLIAANWGDWNVKQEESWLGFHAATNAEKRVLYMGTRWAGHGTPGGDYGAYKNAWLDHYLMGVDNGIENSPTYVSQTATYGGKTLDFYSSNNGFKTRDVELTAQQVARTTDSSYEWAIWPMKPMVGPDSADPTFPSTSINTETHMNHHSRANHDWYYFESPMLKKDVRIFGPIKVQLQLQTAREWVTVTPTILDVDPSCHQYVGTQHISKPECAQDVIYSVTRGWLDSRSRDSLAKQKPLEVNKPFTLKLNEKPVDYTFPKGHHIGLQIATEINEWSIPKPYACAQAGADAQACQVLKVIWTQGNTKIVLPVVNGPKDVNELFDFVHMNH